MKQDTVDMTLLFDFYGDLLTPKQRLLFDLYYNEDYSLAEIAEEQVISRQGVHDAIARAEQALQTYEARTGCVARHLAHRRAMEKIRQETAALAASSDPEARASAQRIGAILDAIKE